MTAKKRTRLKIFLAVAIALAALLAGAWLFVSHELSELENVKETLTTTLSEALDRDVTYQTGKAGLTFRGGLALELSGVVVKSGPGAKDKTTNKPFMGGELVCAEEMLWCGSTRRLGPHRYSMQCSKASTFGNWYTMIPPSGRRATSIS